MVIRKDDVLDSLPLIVENFKVKTDLIYKVNEDEYEKYKQFVIYAELRTTPLDKGNVNGALAIQKEVQEIIQIVNIDPEFELTMYNMRKRDFDIPEVSYNEMKRNHKIVQESNFNTSKLNNDNWNWIKEITEVKDLGSETSTKPVPIKTGELANLIASGMINGDMQLEDGAAQHIVAGGMKQKVQETEETELLANGEEQLIKKKMLYSEPYLNVLISKNGKAKIKELSSGNGVDVSG